MKTNVLILSLLLAVVFSCKKYDCGEKAGCDLSMCEECLNTDYQDPDNLGPGVVKYVLKPLVIDESCGCIVEGYVKYLKDGQTVALVDYGSGECDKWATINNCVDGKCEHKEASCCKFEQVCNGQ